MNYQEAFQKTLDGEVLTRTRKNPTQKIRMELYKGVLCIEILWCGNWENECLHLEDIEANDWEIER